MTNYGYEHKYCLYFKNGCEDDDEDNECPKTYEDFISAIKNFMNYQPQIICDAARCTLRGNAERFTNLADTIDDLKKTMQNVVKQRIADGLDVTLGEKALQDISRL